MTAKTAAEIIASGDAEAAYLYLITDHEGKSPDSAPTNEQLGALDGLMRDFMQGMGDEDYSAGTMLKLSSDEGRRVLLRSMIENGYHDFIGTFVDDRVAQHRPMMIDFFIENCDDPGYYDELFEACAKQISDDQMRRLVESKVALG